MTLNQAVAQTYSYFIGTPLEPMSLKPADQAPPVSTQFLERLINGWVSRVIGPPRSGQRRRSYLLAGVILSVLWVLGRWGDYYYPSATDTGRDMKKLNMSRITYLTPGDVKRLPTIGLGGTWSFPRVKKVTPAVALVLVEETANLTLGQDGLKSIDNLSLRRLVSRPGNLWLNVLASLTDEQVEILARNNEGYLSLNGVKNLSDASAKVLARHNGRVHLRGLEKISDEGRYALRLADATLPHSLQYTTHREAGSDARRVVDP